MRKTRYFFKKTGDIKGIFHARMGMIKDRNSKDLTEGEDGSHKPGFLPTLPSLSDPIWVTNPRLFSN